MLLVTSIRVKEIYYRLIKYDYVTNIFLVILIRLQLKEITNIRYPHCDYYIGMKGTFSKNYFSLFGRELQKRTSPAFPIDDNICN